MPPEYTKKSPSQREKGHRVRAEIRSFNAAAHHMLIAASGSSAVGELPDEFVFGECVQDGDVLRPVARLNAEQSAAPIDPDFLAPRFQKREDANRREHART